MKITWNLHLCSYIRFYWNTAMLIYYLWLLSCSSSSIETIRGTLTTSHCCSAHKKHSCAVVTWLCLSSQQNLRYFLFGPLQKSLPAFVLDDHFILLSNLKPPIPLPSSYLRNDHVFYLPRKKEAIREFPLALNHHSSPSTCISAVDPASLLFIGWVVWTLSEVSYISPLLLCNNITTHLASQNNTHLSCSLCG